MRRSSILIAAMALAIGVITGEGYIPRLSDHTGFYLVPFEGERVPPIEHPRHTYVIVVDGLRRDMAETLRAVQLTRSHGHCMTTDVGPLSLSRPVYAVLSTGLEQDRTGSRNNATNDPLAADSIWDRARDAGFLVTGYSELPWWQELFPRAFERYVTMEADSDLFARLAQDTRTGPSLTLIHPVYVDETAHSFGAASAAYKRAAKQVDDQMMTLLVAIDWQRDLVLITADHGHTDSGGHGGRQPETALVLSCFGGRGVATTAQPGIFDMRAVAPSLALLMGIAFPHHMRAVEDTLDSAFTVLDARAFPASYLNERHKTITAFRAENQRMLGTLGAASWSELYSAQQRWQWARAALIMISVLAFLLWRARHMGMVVWVTLQWGLTISIVFAVTGSFDLTSINQRGAFIGLTLAAAAGSLAVFLLLHLRLMRERAIVSDLRTLVIATSVACIAHVLTYGWPLGYPLPGPQLLFVPLISAISLAVSIPAFLIAELRQ